MPTVSLPKFHWTFDEERKTYITSINGDEAFIERNLKTGKLRGEFAYNDGSDKTMRIPLHDLTSVAQAKIEMPKRIVETLLKVSPEFYEQLLRDLTDAELAENAEAKERI